MEADYQQVETELAEPVYEPTALPDWTAISATIFDRLGGIDGMVEFLQSNPAALRDFYLKQVPERRQISGEDGGPVLIQVRQL